MEENIYAIEARPQCGTKIPKANFYEIYKKNVKDDKVLTAFDGICQLGAKQIIECYSFWNESYTLLRFVLYVRSVLIDYRRQLILI